MIRQETHLAKAARILQIPLATLLLWGFFQPWSTGLGGSASALELKERLAAPRKLSALLKHKSRVSGDYRLAGNLWMVGVAEGATLMAGFIPVLTPWPGLITGLAATGTAWWAGKAIEQYPFQKKGRGVNISLWAGSGLLAISALRFLASRK